MKNWDVIVVGAGPAGSTAARVCADKGLSVLIIDKKDFPRDKACGGGLSIAAVKALDLKIPEYLIEKRCYGIRSKYKGKESVIMESEPVAYMINRIDFDNFLLTKAIESGAVFFRDECRKVTEDSQGVTIYTEKEHIYGSLCIGADGYFSKTSKSVRRQFSDDEVRFCLVTSIEDNKEHPIYNERNPSVELDFGYIPMGYGWLFPKKNHISAGIGGSIKYSKTLKKQFHCFLESHNLSTANPMNGCFIPVSHIKKNSICTQRIMLAGDAAGLVDSFSGEGIKNAIISGKIAAGTAVEALQSGKNASILQYKKKIFSQLGQDLIWSLRISKLSIPFENFIYGNLLFSKRIMKKYFKVMRGEKSYRSFFLESVFSLPLITIVWDKIH